MTSVNMQLPQRKSFSRWLPYFSLIIPGSGQLLQRKIWRGLVIFMLSLVLAFLVFWGNTTFEIGKISWIPGVEINWLWIPLSLFYLWNILDALSIQKNKKIPSNTGHPLWNDHPLGSWMGNH